MTFNTAAATARFAYGVHRANYVVNDASVRKSASTARRDAAQAARSLADLGQEINAAWRRSATGQR